MLNRLADLGRRDVVVGAQPCDQRSNLSWSHVGKDIDVVGRAWHCPGAGGQRASDAVGNAKLLEHGYDWHDYCRDLGRTEHRILQGGNRELGCRSWAVGDFHQQPCMIERVEPWLRAPYRRACGGVDVDRQVERGGEALRWRLLADRLDLTLLDRERCVEG